MATDPAFASTPNNNAALLGAAETSTTVPTTTSTLITAGASGTKLEEVVIQATATTSNGFVYIFLFDGTTYHLFDVIVVSIVTPVAGTTAPFRQRNIYVNEVIKSGWSVRISQSVSGNASILKAHVFAGDF